MLVPTNPDIDVPRLLECVRLELSRSHRAAPGGHASRQSGVRRGEPAGELVAALPALLDTVRVRSAPRTGIPDRLLARFPFLRLPLIGRIVARIHVALFHDQRHANEAVVESLKVLGQAVAALHASRESQMEALRGEMLMMVENHMSRMAHHLDEAKSGMGPAGAGASYDELLQTCRRQEALLEQLVEVTREDISALRRTVSKPNGYAAGAD